MSILEKEELANIRGGSSISSLSSAMINAFTNVIKVLFDAGHSVGSAIRRIAEGELCPLK